MTITVNPPSQILVSAVSDNVYSVTAVNPTPISVTATTTGATGLSAYEIWIGQGHTGTEADFLSSLVGPGVPVGGSARQVLEKIDGSNYNTQWVTRGPAGLDKQVQFNDAGETSADANFLYDKVQQALSVGNPAILPNNPIAAGANIDSYAQMTIQNRNSGIHASSDFVATADNGTDESHYIDMGINSSTYADPAYTLTGPNDGYLMSAGGNLAISASNGPGSKILLAVGGMLSTDKVGEIDSTGINVPAGEKYKMDGWEIISNCNSALEEAAAFAAGAKIVIRLDLI